MAGEETGAKKSEVRSLVLSAGGVDVAAVRALMARDVPSGYRAQTADEIFDDYWRWFRRFRLMEIVGVLGLAAVALIAGMLGYMVWYFVLLGLAILSAVLFRSVVGQRERSITEIITQDCDSAKWRRFMELYDERNRRGFVRRRIACNIAAADYADGRYADAIRRLASISVGERSALRATILNTRALSLYWLGDQGPPNRRSGLRRSSATALHGAGRQRRPPLRSARAWSRGCVRSRHGMHPILRSSFVALKGPRPITSARAGACAWPSMSWRTVIPRLRASFSTKRCFRP